LGNPEGAGAGAGAPANAVVSSPAKPATSEPVLAAGLHVAPFLASNGSAVALLIGGHGELLGAGVLGAVGKRLLEDVIEEPTEGTPVVPPAGVVLLGRGVHRAPWLASAAGGAAYIAVDSNARLIAADPAVERGLESQCCADLGEMLDAADPVKTS
jgi:hypothetical protein